jgi:mRNA interferase MazF
VVIGRGELWWADLGERRGSSPGFRRPVLVVSADAFNRSRIATVVCVTVTSNLRLVDAPGNVAVDEDATGLDRPSVINVSQVVTLDKRDLTDRIGHLDPDALRLVDSGLRRALALG